MSDIIDEWRKIMKNILEAVRNYIFLPVIDKIYNKILDLGPIE